MLNESQIRQLLAEEEEKATRYGIEHFSDDSPPATNLALVELLCMGAKITLLKQILQ